VPFNFLHPLILEQIFVNINFSPGWSVGWRLTVLSHNSGHIAPLA